MTLLFRVTVPAVLITVALATSPASGQQPLEVTIGGRGVQPGEVVRVDVTCACPAAPSLMVFDREIPLSTGAPGVRWEGLVGIDVDTPVGEYPLRVEVPGHEALSRTVPLEVMPKKFRTRKLTVASRYVDPPADVVDRILSEAAMLDEMYATTTSRQWSGPFSLPLETRPTANFGSRSVFNGEPRSPHAGIDFRSPTGTTVRAPAAGTVTLARDLYFTGNTVIIDHGGGLYSVFAHLSSMTVEAGAAVRQGAKLGAVGATGRVTGPHLHWSVRLNKARVDPLSLIEATADRPAPLHAAR